MKTVQTQIPDFLFERLKSLSVKENISIDQLVSMAVSAMIPMLTLEQSIQDRIKRGSWEHFQTVLDRVPSAEPEADDKL